MKTLEENVVLTESEEANLVAESTAESVVAEQPEQGGSPKKEHKRLKEWKKDFKENWKLYLIFLIPFAYFFIFHYCAMPGILMAFQDYSPIKGLWGSKWIGWENFRVLFSGDEFLLVLRNTSMMALLNLTLGFLAPVILALLVSQLRSKRMSRVVQTVTYMPYFVSAVVCCTLAQNLLGSKGAITEFLSWFGVPKQDLLAINGPSFWFINCFVCIWQMAGYSSIIYITTIASTNKDWYDAAAIDGANRWQMMTHITLPAILPMVIMMFTMQIGLVFKQGFDKVLLLYNPGTYEYADVIYTYTYRAAFDGTGGFGISTASGLFQSVIGTVLMVFGNWLSRKLAKTSLF